MKYIALYRKYRPQLFEDVVEQQTVVRILQEALKQKKIAHAYLFAGPKGTGKTSIARIFAKGLNCEKGPTPTPCMKCTQCLTITNGTNLDVIEIDAASNRGIDEIRDLKEKVQYAPVSARYKVYIIDEAHMLTMQAFNALLKTLEEPPHNVVFILATTEPQKIPPTIISRCERFYFKPISLKGLTNKVKEVAEKEGVEITDGAALLIARFATGSLRNALSLLDQAITVFNKIDENGIRELIGVPKDELLKNFLDTIIKKEPDSALSIVRDIEQSGKDGKIFVTEFLNYLQKLLDGKILGFSELMTGIDPSFVEFMKEQSKYVSTKKIVEISFEFANLLSNMHLFPDQFFPIKLAALRSMEFEEITGELTSQEEKPTPYTESHVENAKAVSTPISEKKKEDEAVSESISLDLIKSQWKNVLDEVKSKDKPLHAILERVSPVEVKDDIIVLLAEKKFYLSILKIEKNIKILSDAIFRVLGKHYRVKYIEPEPEKHIDMKENEIANVRKNEVVNKILTLFDGDIVDVREEDKEDKQ